jgi:tetratricopeptide (TPR) repeat protein
VLPPLADESALLSQLQGLALEGRYREVIEALSALPAGVADDRTPLALLAAEACGRLGEFDAAARWAGRALELAQRRLDTPAELRAVHYQGAIAWQRGAVEEAEAHFQRALELARALMDVAAEARAFNNLGILRNLLGLPDEALANYQLALASYQQDGDLRGMAESHTNMEISWLALGKPDRARSAADEAVRLAREVGDQTLIGLALVARAESSLALGDPALAMAELRRAEQAYESVKFTAGIPELRRLEAAVARARADLMGAKRLLEQARALAPGVASLDTQAEIERDLGDTLAGLGDAAGARAARERALALFHRLGARHAEQALTALLATQ